MTSWAKIKIKGKEIIAKLGGYTGATEKKSPIWDIMTANRAWIDKATAKSLNLRIGQRVNLVIAGKSVKGRVYRWSRGSRMIVFDKQLNLSREKAKRIHVDMD